MDFIYNQSPAYLFNVLARLFNQSLSSRLTPHNTSPAQLPVLLSLWQKDGQTQAELCKRMRIEQPTLANTLKRMVRDRLVRKVPDTNDRRQTRIKLTQRGRELKPILTQSALEVHTTAMDGLTKSDMETMHLTLSKILLNLDNDLNQSPLVLDDSIPVAPLASENTPEIPGQEKEAFELSKVKESISSADADADTLILRDADIVSD